MSTLTIIVLVAVGGLLAGYVAGHVWPLNALKKLAPGADKD